MFDKVTLQKLYRYCYSLTCDEHNAYDLLQGALEKFLKVNETVEQPGAYIKKIIYNRFIDECRREKVIQFENIDDADLPADFDVKTLESMFVSDDIVKHILQSLDPEERNIMYFWAIEGFSTTEIAMRLEMPKGTVLSKIYRMRKKLIEQFGDNSDGVMEVCYEKG